MNNQHEKTLFRYYMALEREDLITIERIWAMASENPALAQQLLELDAELRQENNSKIVRLPRGPYRMLSAVAIITIVFAVGAWIVWFSGDNGSDLVTELIPATDIYSNPANHPVHPRLVRTYETGYVANVAWAYNGTGVYDGRTAVYNGTGIWLYNIPARDSRYVELGDVVKHAMFNLDGSRLLVGLANGEVYWFDVETETLELALVVENSIIFVDGINHRVIMESDGFIQKQYLTSDTPIFESPIRNEIKFARYEADGSHLLLADGDNVILYDHQAHYIIPSFNNGETILDIAISRDGNKIAVLTDADRLYFAQRQRNGQFALLYPETAETIESWFEGSGVMEISADRITFTYDSDGLLIMDDGQISVLNQWGQIVQEITVTVGSLPLHNWTVTPDGIFMANTYTGVWLYDTEENSFGLPSFNLPYGNQIDEAEFSRLYQWFDVSEDYVIARDDMLDIHVWDRHSGELIVTKHSNNTPRQINEWFQDLYQAHIVHPTESIVYFGNFNNPEVGDEPPFATHSVVAWNFVTNEETIIIPKVYSTNHIYSRKFTISSDFTQVAYQDERASLTIANLADDTLINSYPVPGLVDATYIPHSQNLVVTLLDRGDDDRELDDMYRLAIFNPITEELDIIVDTSPATGKSLNQWIHHAISPDGLWLATVDSEGVYSLWDIQTREHISFSNGFEDTRNIQFSYDSQRLVFNLDSLIEPARITIVDVASSQVISTIASENVAGHYLMNTKFSRDNLEVFTAFWGQSLAVWDLSSSYYSN